MQTPKQDGFFMPGEFEVHKGCILIWPSRPGSWRNEAREAKKAFAAVIEAIARSEAVFLAARKEDVAEATNFANELKRKQIPYPVTVFEAKTDDAWARDIGPTFVVSDKAKEWCVQLTGNLMPGAEKSMGFMLRGSLIMHLQKRFLPGRAMNVMTQLLLCWKAVRFIRMEKERFWSRRAVC